jgi:NTE family protein
MFWRSRREDVVGLALTGGGARGATQVGALRALIEAGIVPDLIAGTSAGAVNAAWFALHPGTVAELQDIWLSLRTRDVFPGGRLRMLANLARHGHVHDSYAWEASLRRHFGSARFEDAAIQLFVTAARLRDGQRVVFDTGDIVPPLVASSAIPGVFPPYRIDGDLYVDGGVLEYAPIPTLLERGATAIYVLDCSGYSPDAAEWSSAVDRAAVIASAAAVSACAASATERGCTVHVLRPTIPPLPDGRDFTRTAELIQLGYDHAVDYLHRAQFASQRRRDAG